MANTKLNFDINFRTRGNFGPLSQGLNQIRSQSTAAFGAMTTPAIRTKSAIDGLSSSLDRKRLSLSQTRVALRNTSAILKEHNALVNASAISYKNAAGAGKTYLTINRAMTGSVATLNQRFRYTATVLNAASTSLINFGKNVQWAGRQVMMGLTLPLMLVASTASKAAEELDRQLVRIVKVTNVSTYKLANEFGELGASMRDAFDVGDVSAEAQERVQMIGSLIRNQARALTDFGASMGFVAEETGKIGAEFAQMGYQGFQLDALTKSALTLSRVSGTDLNDSIQLVRLTVQAFGNSIGDLEEKFARLNLIENNTSLSLAEMAQGIPIVASVADNLGISIENLAGMLAVMKEQGIAAREGATALRTGLIQLIQKPTRNAVEAFELINVNLNEMQERNRGDIIGFFNELALTMEDMSGSGRQGQANLEMFTQALATLTGVRASARFLSLISEMGNLEKVFDEDTQEEIWKVKEGIDDNDVAARAFINTIYDSERAINIYRYELDQVNNSLSGIRDRLKAELNVELAKMGESFLKVGNAVREAINNALRAFNSLSERTQNIIFSFGTFIAVLGPVTMFMGIFANALGQIAKGVTSLLPKMKLMTASQVAEARAQEITNSGLALSLAMKEDLIATNMRLAASNQAVATSNVLSLHGQLGTAPLPMSIRPGASADERRKASMGVLSASERSSVNSWRDYTKTQREMQEAGIFGPARPAVYPGAELIQKASPSKQAGTMAAAATLAPRLMRSLPGADLGLLGMPLRGGTDSIAQSLQQQIESDLLRTRNRLIETGVIGGLEASGRPKSGARLEDEFRKALTNIGYNEEQHTRDIAMSSGQTGRIGSQTVNQSFLRSALGLSAALAPGAIISGQQVGTASYVGRSIQSLSDKEMADIIRNERIYQLAEMQRGGVDVATQTKVQDEMLRSEATRRGLVGKEVDDFTRRNMPRTLPAAPEERTARTAQPARTRTYTPRTYTRIPKPAPSPLPAAAAPAAAQTAASGGRRGSLLRTVARRGGLKGYGMELAESPLMQYTKSPLGRIGTGRGVAGVAAAGGVLIRSAERAEKVISQGILTASESISRGVRNSGNAAAVAISNAVGPAYAKALTVASRGRARMGDAAYAATAAISDRIRSTGSRARAAGWRAFEGITGQTGGLPEVVSRSQLNATRATALGEEFDQLEQMGRAPEGVSRDDYVKRGEKRYSGARGRIREVRAASSGAQGTQATRFLAGVQRGSQSASYINKALMAAMVMPLKAPFKAVGKLGTVAGKGLTKVASGAGMLGKSKILSGLATQMMAGGGLLKGAAGVALGAGMKLALPLTIVFGTLAITNKDEFMSGLMSTLQGPLDRLRSAWDSLTERFQYMLFLFRNMRGDGEGAFASIAKTIGSVVGRAAGMLMDALTSVITIIQSIFKFVEGLMKLFSGDMSGALEAFGESFKLLGIVILEVILNIADAIVGWMPILGRVIRNAKQTVAGWRENITALDEVEQALVRVDNNIRTIKKSNEGVSDQYEDSLRSIERMSELEIFPMELIDDLISKVDGWEFDPMGDAAEQVDEIAWEIASMSEEMGKLPPQIQDQILSHIELHVVLEAQKKVYEDQKEIKDSLLGLTNDLSDEEKEELENLRAQTSEEEARYAVLKKILDAGGEMKSDPMFGRNMTDEMRAAADALVESGELIKEKGIFGGITSDVYRLNDASQLWAKNFVDGYDRIMARQTELESQTHVGMIRRIEEIDDEEKAHQQLFDRAEENYNRTRAHLGEEHEVTIQHYNEMMEQEALLAAIQLEREDIIDAMADAQESAAERAANFERAREMERHIERLENLKEERKAMLGALDPGSEAYRFASMSYTQITGQIASAQRDLNQLKAEGTLLTEDEADATASLAELMAEARREASEAQATISSMTDPGEAADMANNAAESISSVASAFKSAMGEIMGEMTTAFNSVISDQTKTVTDHFSNISSAVEEYFDNYLDKLSDQTKAIIDQIDQREQAEEDAINVVADLRIQAIEDQADAEAKLDEKRETFFRREQARIDYIRSRATADVQIREAMLKGDQGRAAILRIEQEMAAQQFYNEILKEREDNLRNLREEERERQIQDIEDERSEAIKSNEERASIERIAVEETERNAEEAAKIAQERAEKEIQAAEKAAEEATELEKYRIEQYLKEWQAVTPATEEEFQKHLAALQDFFDQSNNRLRSEINRIYADFSVVFNSMSTDFKDTNNSLMNTLRDRLGSVESQYINTNNNILGAIHSTNVEMANSIEDILNNIGESATTTETILGNARESFKNSIVGMLDELSIASGDTLLDFTNNFVPEFTGNMDWAFGKVEDIAEEFSKRFGNDLEAGFETATDRAIAALTEEKKWKDAENQIAAYMANIAKHLNINIPSPGSGGDGKDKDEESADANAFPGPVTQGQRGEHVRKVQKALNAFIRRDSINHRLLSEDGIFGPQTASAVRAVKLATGMSLDEDLQTVDQRMWNHMRGYFHSGGLVGSSGPEVPSDRLKGDEVSAVLQKGEFVINRRAVALLGTDFLDRINSVQTKFSSPRGAAGTLRGMSGSSTSSTTNTYNLSFHVDGGNIDEQKLAQKVVFEIKKMERDMGMGRRVS